MASTRFDFANVAGRQLSGVLETGAAAPRAYAVFAHCFTCDKTSLAAVRLSRALAAHGIGVLRFDFTGLGDSEGAFGDGLSSDIADLVCAANALAAAGTPAQLMIGHSFGGAAGLAAAGSCPSVKAVATIGAPFDAEHVLHQVGNQLDDLDGDGRVAVSIGGRPFELGAGFVRDIRGHDQKARIASLGRALLVLHAPLDEIVGIDNASGIFLAAKHPKSFVTLDRADHLLRRKVDSDYAAAVIAAWAGRYLDLAVTDDPALPLSGVRVDTTGTGKFEVRATTPSGSFLIDEPPAVGGGGSGPTPYDLLSASLGACTAMTMRLYGARKEWPVGRVTVEVGHVRDRAGETFTRRIGIAGPLDDAQRDRLFEIADRCPVHRTLTTGAVVVTQPLTDAAAGTPDTPEDHAAAMAAACSEN